MDEWMLTLILALFVEHFMSYADFKRNFFSFWDTSPTPFCVYDVNV